MTFKGDPLKGAISIISLIIFVVLIINVAAQVVFRYVLQLSVPWTEEAARVAMIWMVFFGLILAQADKAQIRIDHFVSKLAPFPRRAVEIVVEVASIIFLLAVIKGGYGMIHQTRDIMMGAIPWLSTPILYVPAVIAPPFAIWYILRGILFTHSAVEKGERQ